MAKYIAYINVKDMPMAAAKSHVDEARQLIQDYLMEPNDKLLVMAVREGNTRIELVPNT